MKRTILGVLGAGLLVTAVVGMVKFWPHLQVDSTLTASASPPTSLVCYGYVDARGGPLLLQPARSGRVVQVFVKEGQTVVKDTPLLQLDDALVKLQEQEADLAVEAAEVQVAKAKRGLIQYQATLAQAKAALEAARVKLQGAEHVLAVAEKALKDGVVNKGQIDLARDQRDGARALVDVEQNKLAAANAVEPELDVKLAQLQRERSQIQQRQARREKEEYVVKSPTEAIVLRMLAQPGDLLSPSSPRPALWLAPVGNWIVRAEVAQEFAGRVREGQDVQVEDEASGRLLTRAKVASLSDWFLPRRQFSALPTSINTGLTMECVIELNSEHAQLRFGQRVRVRVLAESTAP